MQFLVARLIGAFAMAAGSLVGRVLLALGISFVTYTGFDTGVVWLKDQIISNMSAMPAEVVSLLAWLWVDKAIGMTFSAYTAALAIKMAGGNSVTRMVTK
jgi:hypothetical protein